MGPPRNILSPGIFMIIYGNKEALVATHHTFTTTYFDNMWDNMWVQFFLGKKLMNIFDLTQKYSQGHFMIIYVN